MKAWSRKVSQSPRKYPLFGIFRDTRKTSSIIVRNSLFVHFKRAHYMQKGTSLVKATGCVAIFCSVAISVQANQTELIK